LLDRRTDVTSADIEAWLSGLFPDGLAERRALLASVDRIVAEDPAGPSKRPPSSPRVEQTGSKRAHDGADPSEPVSSSPPVEQTGAKTRLLAALGALLLALGAGVALGWWALSTSDARGPNSLSLASANTPPVLVAAGLVATAPVDAGPADTGVADAGRDAGLELVEVPAPRRATSPRSRPAPPAPLEGPLGELRVGLRAAAGGLLPDDAWAEVRVDGRAADGSPPFTLRLAPGRHLVEVTPYGRGPTLRRTIEIEPGGREIAIFAIDPL
jgi:hypothetical protein